MLIDNRAKKISRRLLLTPADAAGLTDPSDIGQDPLVNDPQKYAIRDEAFASRCPSNRWLMEMTSCSEKC